MAFLEVTAIGNLTRDPELRVTPKGSAICQFGLAVNKKWKDDSGQEREDVTFIDVEAWGKQAEVVAKYFTKGKPIYIRGSIKQDTWEDKQTGQKKSKHKIVLERFEFIGGKDPAAPAPAPQSSAPAPRVPGGRPAPAPRHDINDEDVPF